MVSQLLSKYFPPSSCTSFIPVDLCCAAYILHIIESKFILSHFSKIHNCMVTVNMFIIQVKINSSMTVHKINYKNVDHHHRHFSKATNFLICQLSLIGLLTVNQLSKLCRAVAPSKQLLSGLMPEYNTALWTGCDYRLNVIYESRLFGRILICPIKGGLEVEERWCWPWYR